ncbi:MAG TPA: helix-turn-helix transcriptional regulator [Tepidisphaeraceae bacterium]|nr:helix-turn-helix transcriptional regulator [Tepidisphaeraceae bacterium]
MQTITKHGKKYALVPLGEWRRLNARFAPAAPPTPARDELPPLPPAAADGTRDALDFARVTIARRIIQERTAAGFSQAELARRAGMDRSTLNRIERAKVTLDESTYRRLEKAMRRK